MEGLMFHAEMNLSTGRRRVPGPGQCLSGEIILVCGSSVSPLVDLGKHNLPCKVMAHT